MMNPDIEAVAEGRLPHRCQTGFDGLVGLEIVEVTRERARARLELRPELLQPMGLLHGGVVAAVSESLASMATAHALWNDGLVVMGQSNLTSFLRPITQGRIEATATVVHSGRTTWIWDVELCDAAGRRCALTRMTIAVRSPPQRPADA